MNWYKMKSIKPEKGVEALVLEDKVHQFWVGYCDQPGVIRIVTSGILQDDGDFKQFFTHVSCDAFERWMNLKVYIFR